MKKIDTTIEFESAIYKTQDNKPLMIRPAKDYFLDVLIAPPQHRGNLDLNLMSKYLPLIKKMEDAVAHKEKALLLEDSEYNLIADGLRAITTWNVIDTVLVKYLQEFLSLPNAAVELKQIKEKRPNNGAELQRRNKI